MSPVWTVFTKLCIGAVLMMRIGLKKSIQTRVKLKLAPGMSRNSSGLSLKGPRHDTEF
jgi:hypothetical protein